MTKLFVDIAWESLNHYGEELCGDKVEIVRGDDYVLAVLADGLGSGVKANILSTMTSKIISTMFSGGGTLADVVDTMAETLPVCAERGVAYSTFTIVRIADNGEIYIVEFDNPDLVYFHANKAVRLEREEREMGGKRIFVSRFKGEPGDMIVMFSDGVVHAGVGRLLDLGWLYESVVDFLKENITPEISPLMLTRKLLSAVNTLYMDQPGDDSTVCSLRLKPSRPATVMVGPPVNKEMDEVVVGKLMHAEGLRVVCGGSTSQIVSRVTGRPLDVSIDYENPAIPPTAKIPGIDLVTEGVLTIGKTLDIIRALLEQNDPASLDTYTLNKKDGATLLAKVLLEDSTEIHFLVGRALNPAHQNPGMPVSLGLKLNLIKDLAAVLESEGKHVSVEYF